MWKVRRDDPGTVRHRDCGDSNVEIVNGCAEAVQGRFQNAEPLRGLWGPAENPDLRTQCCPSFLPQHPFPLSRLEPLDPIVYFCDHGRDDRDIGRQPRPEKVQHTALAAHQGGESRCVENVHQIRGAPRLERLFMMADSISFTVSLRLALSAEETACSKKPFDQLPASLEASFSLA